MTKNFISKGQNYRKGNDFQLISNTWIKLILFTFFIITSQWMSNLPYLVSFVIFLLSYTIKEYRNNEAVIVFVFPFNLFSYQSYNTHFATHHTIHRPKTSLTHWGRNKMVAISQTTFSSAFSLMKMFQLRLKFHWSLFLRVQLTIFKHWFR